MSWPCPASSSNVGTAKSGVPMKIKRSGMSDLHAGAPRPFGERVHHAVLSGDVARLLRRALGVLLAEFGLLCEFLDDAVALELGNMVDKQHSVEVVEFVLQAGR